MGYKTNKHRLIIALAIVLVIAIVAAGLATPNLLSNKSKTSTSTSTTTFTSSNNGFPVTFTASGLDSSANSTVISTSTGDISYGQLPYTAYVQSGTTITFSYQANVTTTADGCLFQLSAAPSSSSIIVTAPVTVNATYGRAIIDSRGVLIKIPPASQINRIADLWADHSTIDVICGAGTKLVATHTVNAENPMFQKILPQIATIFNSSSTPNIESLLATHPDIVFYASAAPAEYATEMENAGLLVIRQDYSQTFAEMLYNIRQTGWILGEQAYEKALAYIDYFNQIYNEVYAKTSQIPEADRPVVLHLDGESLTTVDTGAQLDNAWITLCGGRNAAADITDATSTAVSMEQILEWNPDVILVGGVGSQPGNDTAAEIMSNPEWSQINAVKNDEVLANPVGVFDWSRYSVEEPLNILWVAQMLHPALFSDINIRNETEYFYETFYGYTLSNAELNAILNGTPI